MLHFDFIERDMNTLIQTKRRIVWVAAAAISIFVLSCKEEPPPSLYQPITSTGPTITTVSPNDSALAGIGIVTIVGTGFSPVKEYNFVNFGSKLATVLEATVTQLKVRTPNLVSDSTPVKVAVQGMDLFSSAIAYKLKPAVVDFGGTPNVVEEPGGIATDARGNLYVSLLGSTGIMLGVKKITPTGARTDFAPRNSRGTSWSSLRVGPGDTLYNAANQIGMFRIFPNGVNEEPFWFRGGVGSIFDVDFDQGLNIWAGGDNQEVYRIKRDKSIRSFPFAGDVRSVRVYNGNLYCATKNDSVWNIWRSRIVSADSLAPRELYFNFSANYPNAGAYAITFSTDGDMFVGTDPFAGSMVVVHPDRTHEKFYPGLFSGTFVTFAYGIGNEMYVSSTGTDANKKVLRVNMQKQGAPYYGRQ